MELDEKFHFLRKAGTDRGFTVIDLGGAPGGWSQVAAQKLGANDVPLIEQSPLDGKNNDDPTKGSHAGQKAAPLSASTYPTIITVDILPIQHIPGVHLIQGDFLSSATRSQITRLLPQDRNCVDVVLSDMAPNMSGNRLRDIDLSLELCTSAFQFARDWLATSQAAGNRRAGALIMKYFEHPELQDFRKHTLDTSFNYVSHCKPKSSRSESSEAFFVCQGFKG